MVEGPQSNSELIDDSVPVSFMLFDLESDIKETNDISGNSPEIVKEMHELLEKYIIEGRSN